MAIGLTARGKIEGIVGKGFDDGKLEETLNDLESKNITAKREYEEAKINLEMEKAKKKDALENVRSINGFKHPIKKTIARRAYRRQNTKVISQKQVVDLKKLKAKDAVLSLRNYKNNIRRVYAISNDYNNLKEQILIAESKGIAISDAIKNEVNKTPVLQVDSNGYITGLNPVSQETIRSIKDSVKKHEEAVKRSREQKNRSRSEHRQEQRKENKKTSRQEYRDAKNNAKAKKQMRRSEHEQDER